jgi:hypothetical protein
MPSFTISAPATGPIILRSGAGSVAFTVTNTSQRTVAGMVSVVPEPPAADPWFRLDGAASRTFQPGGVEQVPVAIAVPAGTPAASYAFRLDAKAEENPDEDYTEGPSVSFAVAEPARAPWWKKYWWIIAIAAVVLIAIVLAVVLLTGGDDTTDPVDPNETVSPAPALSAPTLTSPADGATFDIFPRTTRLQWEAVQGAAKYRVERAYCLSNCDTDGTPYPLQDVDGTEFTFDFVGAQPGRWRVWAIDAQGVEGPKSPYRTFRYLR